MVFDIVKVCFVRVLMFCSQLKQTFFFQLRPITRSDRNYVQSQVTIATKHELVYKEFF